MLPAMEEWLWRLLIASLVVAALSLVTALVLAALLYRRLRRLRVPEDAGFWTTVRAVPLGLVVVLDLLDLSLDFLSAPLVWWALGRLRLLGLREIATLHALVPFTGPLPLLTIAWVLSRSLGLGEALDPDVIETRQVSPGRFEPRP
jgi:hypothetical protein